MICPKCNYSMGAFDDTCPRCHGNGIQTPPRPSSQPATAVAAAAPSSRSPYKYCQKCNKKLGVIEMVTALATGCCSICSNESKAKLNSWRLQFLAACSDGIITPVEWNALRLEAQALQLDRAEAVAFIRNDALAFVERTFVYAKSDGVLDENEERQVRWLIDVLGLASAAPHLLPEIARLANLRNIRNGNLPRVAPSVVLPSDELCHLEWPATYAKVGKRETVNIPGRLIVTNKKLIFTSNGFGGEIPLGKILNVIEHPAGVYLELSRQANSGFYGMAGADVVTAIISTAIKIHNRQLLSGGDRDTRRIPQHIKAAVWQRDGGRCVECGAGEYLELDHIIPHSKGGATSENNLQLLCRGCNGSKSDKI